MEPSDWLSAAVALVVGIGSALLTNVFANEREKRSIQQKRRDALVNYERTLADWSLYYFSCMGDGAGNHPRPTESDLRDAWAAAYPYLEEFKGHGRWNSIISPYYEPMPGDFPNDPMEFYDNASRTIAKHLREYAEAPKSQPYLEGDDKR